MAILKNSVIVAFWTAASRGLGFARDLLIANKLGAGLHSDAFFIALMLPNLLRRLFAEGAFNVAFVPILARHKGHSREEALAFASATFSWLLTVVTLVCALGVLIMPVIVSLLASGWVNEPEKFQLAVHLGRITFPYLGLITVAAFLGALCNTFGKFAAYAMVPALLNLSILACLFILPGFGTHPVEAAAWSVPLGGIAQAAYMIWASRQLGLRLTLRWLPQHKDLKPLLYRMGPAALGVGILQISLLIDNQVASFLGSGAISYLQYANRFYQLPLSLIGIAVATVLLPHLAVLLGEGNRKEATRSFTSAMVACLTLAVGATVGMFLLAPELLSTTFQHGEFTETAARATAWAMMAFVLGLPAFIVTKVTAPAFFANEDPASPVKASGIALLCTFLLNVGGAYAMVLLGHGGMAHVVIALATAIGGWINASLQWRWLTTKGVLDIDLAAMKRATFKMLFVAGAVAGPLLLMKFVLPYNYEGPLWAKILWLAGAITLGFAGFGASVHRTGLLDLKALLAQARQAKTDKNAIKLKADSGE